MKILTRPPIIGSIILVINIIANYFYPIAKVVIFPINLFGIIIIILGLYIAIKNKNLFDKLKVPVIPLEEKPTKLVTSGTYKISRNPMYLGLLISSLGIFILFGTITMLAGPIIFFFILNNWLIPKEEEMMYKTFGKKYLEYKNKVRKWI